MWKTFAATGLMCLAGGGVRLVAQQWPFYGGDAGGSKYSALDKINVSNVAKLKPAWEWKSGEVPMAQFNRHRDLSKERR